MNYKVDYVGNPSVDSVAGYLSGNPATEEEFRRAERLTEKPLLALLAGSRKQEIADNLPTMLKVASHYPEFQPVVAGAPGIDPSYYSQYTGSYSVGIVFNKTYPLLQHSRLALVTSGTATLETSLFRVPQVVCYYTPMEKVASFVFRRFFHIRFISLVNLIAGKEVVQELFGARFSPDNIQQEVGRILYEPGYREKMLAHYDEVVRILGTPGASAHTAELIVRSFGNRLCV
jgi:lipid-A-disaccharide synthase